MQPLTLADLDVLRPKLEAMAPTDMDAVRALGLGQVAQETGYPGVEEYALRFLTLCADRLGYRLDPEEEERRKASAARLAIEEQQALDEQKELNVAAPEPLGPDSFGGQDFPDTVI